MNKKAALELSMNTIIIIVIGVVLLSLGLMFVRGIFGNVNDLSEQAFEGAENAINEIATHDQKLTLPQQIKVEQGKTKTSKVWVVNEEPSEQTFVVVITPSTGNDAGEKLKLTLPGSQVNLDTGEEVGFVIGIEASKTLAKGLYSYEVKVNGGDYAVGTFFVKVE